MPALTLDLVLMIGRTIALIGTMLLLAIALRRWHHSAERDAQRMFEQLDLIRIEILLLADRMDGLEAAAPRANERSVTSEPRIPVANNNSTSRGYEVAARLARGGATCEELISSCGLSRHEAELLLRLHGAEAARNKLAEKNSDKPPAAAERRTRLSVVG